MPLSHTGRIDLGSYPGRSGDERQLVDADVRLAVEPAGVDERTGEPRIRLAARAPLPAAGDDRMEVVLSASEAKGVMAALSEALEDA